MDWVSIISAGIAGGAGGALGAIVGSLFQNNSIRTGLVVVLAVVGGNLGQFPQLLAADQPVQGRDVALADLYQNDGIHYLTRRPNEIVAASMSYQRR